MKTLKLTLILGIICMAVVSNAQNLNIHTTSGEVFVYDIAEIESITFTATSQLTHTPCPGIPTISYGGQTYNTVLIGDQCWLKENLNYTTSSGSWCHDNSSTNCDTYGRLYDWETALTVCPSGWHLPSDDEWKILEGTVDTQYPVGDPEWDDGSYRGYDVGKRLKAISGWDNDENGTDAFGFSGLPGGDRNYYNGNFNSLGGIAKFWTSTENDTNQSWGRYIRGGDEVGRYWSNEENGYSVRCVKD